MPQRRRGWRGEKQRKTQKNERLPSPTSCSRPKIIVLFITQTTEVRNNQCMCSTAMNIIRIINPKRTTCTQLIFGSLNKQPTAFTSRKTKQRNEKGMRNAPPGWEANSCSSSYQRAHRKVQPSTRQTRSDSVQSAHSLPDSSVQL